MKTKTNNMPAGTNWLREHWTEPKPIVTCHWCHRILEMHIHEKLSEGLAKGDIAFACLNQRRDLEMKQIEIVCPVCDGTVKYTTKNKDNYVGGECGECKGLGKTLLSVGASNVVYKDRIEQLEDQIEVLKESLSENLEMGEGEEFARGFEVAIDCLEQELGYIKP